MNTYTIVCGSVTLTGVSGDDVMTKAGELFASEGAPPVVTKEEPRAEEPAPAMSTWEVQVSDKEAETRIQAQQNVLSAKGYTVGAGQQFYATGTRMAAEGYATQEGRHKAFLGMKDARDAAHEMAAAIHSESRHTEAVGTKELACTVRLNEAGRVVCLDGYRVSERAVRQLLARTESPALSYLLGLSDRMRATHALIQSAKREGLDGAEYLRALNSDRERYAETLAHELASRDEDVVLRLRDNPKDVFAAVTDRYGICDAPDVLGQILEGLPEGAKASWSYDPMSTQWQFRAETWTPTAVADQAVGEPFQGYASIRGRDNGTGRVSGGGGIVLIRCLNASVYEAGNVTSRVHRGRKVKDDMVTILRAATVAVNDLAEAWGVQRNAILTTPEVKGAPVSLEEAIPGFYRWLLRDQTSELSGILTGKTESHVAGLTKAFHQERRDSDRLVRSDIAQGWTRYIQGQTSEKQAEAEVAIGSWLVKSAPLAYLSA